MDEAHIRAKIMAAAYMAAAELGSNRAIELLQSAAQQIKDDQWRGPANR